MSIFLFLCFPLFRWVHSWRMIASADACEEKHWLAHYYHRKHCREAISVIATSTLDTCQFTASYSEELPTPVFSNKTHWHLPICISTLVKRCVFKMFVKYFWHFVCLSQMLIWSWWMLVGTYLPSAFGLLSSMESIFSSWEFNFSSFHHCWSDSESWQSSSLLWGTTNMSIHFDSHGTEAWNSIWLIFQAAGKQSNHSTEL